MLDVGERDEPARQQALQDGVFTRGSGATLPTSRPETGQLRSCHVSGCVTSSHIALESQVYFELVLL